MLLLIAAQVMTSFNHAKTYDMFFMGNSLVYMNDLPAMTKQVLESDGSGRKVTTQLITAAHLNDAANNVNVRQALSRKWDCVVLQGAMVSMSHNYIYDNDPATGIAKAAEDKGSRTLFMVEWSRRGIAESDFTYKIYDGMAKDSGAEAVPVCYAWDNAIKAGAPQTLWAPDGNHPTSAGTYLAACTLYYWITGPAAKKIAWRPTSVDSALAGLIQKASRLTVERLRPKKQQP